MAGKSLGRFCEFFFRGDDGTFLLRKKTLYKKGENHVLKLSPAYPLDYNLSSNDTLALSLATEEREILNETAMELNISIENFGQSSYGIQAYTNSDYFSIEENRLSFIRSGETQKFSLKVYAKLPRKNPVPLVNELNVSILTNNGSKFHLAVPIKIYAHVLVQSAEVSEDGKNLNVLLKNNDTEKISKAFIRLLNPFENNASQEIKNLEAKGTVPISYVLPIDKKTNKTMVLDDDALLNLVIFVENEREKLLNPVGTKIAPAYEWHLGKGVTIVLNEMAWYIYLLMVMVSLFLLGSVWYYRRYKNAMVLRLQNNPKELLTLNAQQLIEAKEKLKSIKELERTLATINIDVKRLDEALAFNRGEEQALIFSARIKKSTLTQEGEFYKLNSKNTKLSVDDFLLCFTDEKAEQIEERFKESGDRVFVVGSFEHQDDIDTLARDKTNNIIATTQTGLNAFLLSSKSEAILMKIFAECLEFSSISPYQTSKGINKEMNFFGRINIVRDMKMHSNRIYMIVGGRQLGKSSILKKLHRSYEKSSTVDGRFINLEGKRGNIVLAMALNFGLGEDATLHDVTAYIHNSKKKMLLLIDEVDEFIAKEIEQDYAVLKALKNLAEEEKVSFVLAGFWTLYQDIVANYQSPLYNIGELIVLEGLERAACKELMLEPMKRIGIGYEDEKILDEVISTTGQRANLIATICDESLKRLEGKTLSNKLVREAMLSQAVSSKLLGWGNIDNSNEQNSRLDRIIVYLTINKEQFELDDVLMLLEEEKVNVDASAVNKSLERLVIMYVLKKELGRFSYRIPLMKRHILQTNEKGRRALLDEEIGKFEK